MTEMQSALKMLSGKFSTCIQQINYPIHKGQPNPAHGKFMFVGSIPGACINPETGRSKHYTTEQDAADAAFAAGITRVQGVDCRWIERS